MLLTFIVTCARLLNTLCVCFMNHGLLPYDARGQTNNGRRPQTVCKVAMSDEKSSDRRKHTRFRVKTGGLALVPSEWPRSTVVGDILDISTGGVALQYVGDMPDLKTLNEIGIAGSTPSTFLGKLPVKKVSDLSMVKIPFGALVPRRLSLEFEELTQDQTTELMEYIEGQAVASV